MFVAGVGLEGKLVVQPNPIKWLNPSSSAVKQIEELQSVTGSDNQIAIIVNSRAPFSKRTIDYVTHLTEVEKDKYGSILSPGAGLISSTDDFLTIAGADVVPPTPSEIKQFYDLAPVSLQRQMVGTNGSSLNVTLLSRTNDFARLEPIIQNLSFDAPPPRGIAVAPGGIGVVSVGLLENLAAFAFPLDLSRIAVRWGVPRSSTPQHRPIAVVAYPRPRRRGSRHAALH